jgi:hypothetical protein
MFPSEMTPSFSQQEIEKGFDPNAVASAEQAAAGVSAPPSADPAAPAPASAAGLPPLASAAPSASSTAAAPAKKDDWFTGWEAHEGEV